MEGQKLQFFPLQANPYMLSKNFSVCLSVCLSVIKILASDGVDYLMIAFEGLYSLIVAKFTRSNLKLY